MPIGLFGASTGAAAALVVAATGHSDISAVVSRGGRPDLAGDALPRVKAPTLLIVGGADVEVLTLNRNAMERMSADVRLEVVPGATHLFHEPGALETVAELAGKWFTRFFVGRRSAVVDRQSSSDRRSSIVQRPSSSKTQRRRHTNEET
jgi:dienelactone hydrolase